MRKEQERNLFAQYAAECLRMLTENTAKISGGQYMTRKFYDLLEPGKEESEDERSGKEIAAEVCEKCGLKVVKQYELI